MSGGGGGSKTTTEIDPAMMKLYKANYQRAEGVAGTPFQPYADQRFASLNNLQNQAIDQTQANAGLLSGGLSGAYSAMQAGLDPDVRDVSAGTIADADLSRYMNPYTDQVISNSLTDLDQARQMAIGRGEDQALAANAYGGSREGVADSLTNQAFAQQAADLSGRLRAQGFVNAQQMAGTDIASQYNAILANQGADLNRAQLSGTAANNLTSLGLGAPGMLAQVGAQQQGLTQQGLDFAYQQFLAERAKPTQDIGLLNSVLSGIPTGTTTSGSQPGGSPAAGAAGGAMSGAAMGSAAGPYGAAIGAVGGGLMGYFGSA